MSKIIHSVIFSKEPLKTSTHYHDCHQIIYILKGKAEICVNSAKLIANEGNIVLFSRYENHSVTVLSDEYERFVLRINPQIHNGKSKIFSLLSNRPKGFNNVIDVTNNQNELKSIFNSILTEFNLQDEFFEDMISSLLDQLLITIYRSLLNYNGFFNEESFEIVSNLQKEFESNYHLNFSLDQLSKTYNISVSSLSHQFKKITGVSIMNYLLSCRIANAKKLLAKTNLTISEIVVSCGFSDTSNFCRMFKKLNGVSPRDFRKKNKF